MMSEAQWGQWINNLRAENLPEDGKDAPGLESISVTVPKEVVAKQKVFVQRLTTQVYLYTDVENHVYGQSTFQDVTIFGEMTVEKLNKIVEREKKKRNKGTEEEDS